MPDYALFGLSRMQNNWVKVSLGWVKNITLSRPNLFPHFGGWLAKNPDLCYIFARKRENCNGGYPIKTSIVRTKLTRPRVHSKWVQRPRLISRLDEGLDKRAKFISAPAGYGKTTLAVQWLDRIPGDSALLSLDKRDNDPGFSSCTRSDRESMRAAGKVGAESSQKAVVGLDGRSFYSGWKRSGYVWMDDDVGS